MSRRSFVLRRLAGMVLTVWAVLTTAFAVVVFTTDPAETRIVQSASMSGEDPSEAVDAYLAATNQNVPVSERYVDWLVGLAKLDLGWSYTREAAVTTLLADHVAFTLVYFLPALAFAVIGATGIRLYTGAAEDTRLDRLTDGLSYVAVSVPVFLFAYAVKWWVLPAYFVATNDEIAYTATAGPLAPGNLQAAVFPATVMGLYLFGIQLRYAGAELGEYASAEFVKTARGKGSSVWRVGRHMLRNAVVPLASVFFTDLFGMVLLAVYVVEVIASVPGLGGLTVNVMTGGHDLPLMLGVVLLPALVGVVANFLRDVGYALFYPRVELES
ncbi:ABC transporter permease [Halorussus salilacus]|uniref:ABC transporter permease n=1 Tax=Halorussus salilacus TaxID=2953750 RepID=UPI00209D95F3|nr:ABC transporter permease [Halorussus salilacus]USZ67959.1 ABC transporter permease [Halorussus salilacus]